MSIAARYGYLPPRARGFSARALCAVAEMDMLFPPPTRLFSFSLLRYDDDIDRYYFKRNTLSFLVISFAVFIVAIVIE